MKKLILLLPVLAMSTFFLTNGFKLSQQQQLELKMTELKLIDESIAKLRKKGDFTNLEKAMTRRAFLGDEIKALGGTLPVSEPNIPGRPLRPIRRPAMKAWELAFKTRLRMAPCNMLKGYSIPVKAHLREAMERKWKADARNRAQAQTPKKCVNIRKERKEWRRFIQQERENFLQARRAKPVIEPFVGARELWTKKPTSKIIARRKLNAAKRELRSLALIRRKTAGDLARIKKLEKEVTELREIVRTN